MNFSPFGGHFPTSIPGIHQFAAKFGHDTSGRSLFATQDGTSSRYPTNSISTFSQQHTISQQQQVVPTNKYQGNGSYINENGIYTHQNNPSRIDKIQNYDAQHELAQELCAAMLQGGQEQKQNNEKVGV